MPDYLKLPRRKALNSYSWLELSLISSALSSANSLEEKLSIAERHNFYCSNGNLNTWQVKEIKLKNGLCVHVGIAGLLHDEAIEKSCKAGITFHFIECVSKHRMNESCRNSGGWSSSKMRSWLNSEFISSLPTSLVEVIVPVAKLSNNVGKTNSASSVTTTIDKLWLFSSCELAGVRNWYENQEYNNVLNSEGMQYPCFAQNPTMLRKQFNGEPCSWWQRSAYPNGEGGFRNVGHKGDVDCGDFSDYSLGVAPGFCL